MQKVNVNIEDFDLSETPVICDVEVKTEVLALAQPLSTLEKFDYPCELKHLVTFKSKNFENLKDIVVEVIVKSGRLSNSDTSCNYDFPRIAKAEIVNLDLCSFIDDEEIQKAIGSEYADFYQFVTEATKYAMFATQRLTSFNFDPNMFKEPDVYKDREVTIYYPSYQY